MATHRMLTVLLTLCLFAANYYTKSSKVVDVYAKGGGWADVNGNGAEDSGAPSPGNDYYPVML